MSSIRKPYPSDVSDDEWTFVAAYLVLLAEDASQRRYPLREVFNGVRYIVKTGAHWRMLPHDLPPWPTVYQQMRRWMAAGCIEAIVHDLWVLLRRAHEHAGQPTAAILDSWTLQSTPESGGRASYDGHKRHKGSKMHAAVDTLGHLLALVVTLGNEQDRAQVGQLATALQEATGGNVELAYVDQGYTGAAPAAEAAAHGLELAVIKLPEAKRGFVLLPCRWVVERDFAWASRFRRLTCDYERLAATLVSLHFLAFAWLMLQQLLHLVGRTELALVSVNRLARAVPIVGCRSSYGRQRQLQRRRWLCTG